METGDGEEPPLAIAIDDVVETGLSRRPDLPETQSVGVTVITGYLGAGKSTVRGKF